MPLARTIILLLAVVLPMAGQAEIQDYTYSPTTAAILNPERGFYLVGADNGSLSDLTTNYAAMRSQGVTLVYTRVDLSAFRTTSISPLHLDNLESGLERVRDAGVKAVVRIVYNDGYEDDVSFSRLQAHLLQLQPMLARNSDVIAFVQAGVIGAWGEWHSTTNFGPEGVEVRYNLPTVENRRAVISALLAFLPSNAFVQVRRPWFKDPAFGNEALFPGEQVTAETAFTSAPVARIGHHNDCFLSSSTDQGTYESSSVEEQKAFLAADTRFVPMGGETCAPSEYTTCPNALAELARFHATYLNRVYHPDVIAEWQTGGCYAEIERRLGYRFELVRAQLPDEVRGGETFAASVTVRNVGFAPMYQPRPVVLRLILGTEVLAEWPMEDADPRRWLAEDGEIVLDGLFTLPREVDAAQGARWVLWLPDNAVSLRDRPEYSVRMANQGTWDASRGENILGTGIGVLAAEKTAESWIVE
ncbi:MAG: hypothetical protein PWP23_1204 [Candidatus Sumerlaeota bacterium]|nr:hypothetical protein [Candidatus Sumerlaeota bacterium]